MKGKLLINDNIIHYELKGEGKVLCFIHGFSLDSEIWDYQFEYFSKNHKVLRYDLRGFGKSEMNWNNEFSHFEDLKVLLDYLEINNKVTLIGMSLGCRVALDFVISYPNYIENIIISAPSLNSHIDPILYNFKILLTSIKAKIYGINSAKKYWLKHPLFKSMKNNEIIKNKVKNIVGNYSGLHWINGNYLEILGQNNYSNISLIKVPVLIIVGKLELKSRSELALKMNKKIQNSVLKYIEKGGHFVNIENSPKYNEEVYNFLNINI